MMPFQTVTPESDHDPIIWHKARHDTAKGGWDEWGCGCTCGWLDKGPGYIPSEVSAKRVYERHLSLATGRDIVDSPVEEPEDALDEWFARLIEGNTVW